MPVRTGRYKRVCRPAAVGTPGDEGGVRRVLRAFVRVQQEYGPRRAGRSGAEEYGALSCSPGPCFPKTGHDAPLVLSVALACWAGERFLCKPNLARAYSF